MARPPLGNDRDQIKAVADGVGSIAIVNSYYYFQMLNSDIPAEVKAASGLKIHYPEDVHINMTWLGVTKKGSKNDSVGTLITFLTSKEAQQMYYEENYEFAVNSEVEMDITPPIHEPVDYATLGKYEEEALAIFEEAGWI